MSSLTCHWLDPLDNKVWEVQKLLCLFTVKQSSSFSAVNTIYSLWRGEDEGGVGFQWSHDVGVTASMQFSSECKQRRVHDNPPARPQRLSTALSRERWNGGHKKTARCGESWIRKLLSLRCKFVSHCGGSLTKRRQCYRKKTNFVR